MGPQEHKIERRLAAIFAADVAGYSRLMEQDEVGTLRTLTTNREIMDRLIVEHGGRIANTAGDSVLAEFPSVVDAVQCAVAVQETLAQASHDTPDQRRVQFRIGVHVGDVMVQGRGSITVLDRPRLQEAACECYGKLRGKYLQLLPLKRSTPSKQL